MRLVAKLTAVLVLLLPPVRVAALDSSKTIPQYHHVVWGPEQGLEGFSVNDILETRDGYIWIATDEGLARFDGVHFTLYNRATAPAMTAVDVACLAEDPDGALWFGTRGGGLYRLRRDSLSRFGVNEGLGGEYVLALHIDREGTLWIGVQEYGVAKLERNGFKRYLVDSDQGLNACQTFYERADGTIYFAYGSVYERRPGDDKFRPVLQHNEVLCTFVEDRESLIAGTDSGLVAVIPATGPAPLGGAVSGMFVRSLLRDRDGNLWIGTEGNGLLRYSDGRVSTYTTKDGLSSDRVLSLYEDRHGNLWISTRGGGLNRLSNTRISVYGTSEGMTSDIISAVFEDHRGNWWIGTRGGGMNVLRGGSLVGRLTAASGLSSPIVRSIAEGPPGTIWIGTQNGLNRLALDSQGRINPATGPAVITIPVPRSPSVRALYTDADGNLWVGEYGGGLYTFDGHSLKPLPPFSPQVLGDRTIHTIYRDAKRVLWVGTHAGLYGVTGDSVRRYSLEQGLGSSLVYAIAEDEHRALWIGTYGGGLYRLKEGKLAAISKNNGLFDDVIFAILDDSLGSFWMSSNRGIFRVAKRELNEVADGTRSTLSCEVFGLEEGLRSIECNGGAQPAAVRTRDGALLFPTMKGLVVIDPAQHEEDEPPVTPRLEEIRVDTFRFSQLAEHQLPLGNRTIDFHYTALGSGDPRRLEFRYRLNGFESRMVDAGTQRSARYTNLPPGTYTFSVAVRRPGGAWSAPATSAAITVPPHLYETWWAKVLAGIAAAVALGMLFRSASERKARRRIEALERDHALERERARIARDMHDEIGASLTKITILSDLLGGNLRSPETAEPYLRKISSTARDVVGSLDEIVWFINPRHDSLESLLLYIREYVADYLDAVEIRCAFAFPETIPPAVLAADVRRNIFLAVKEAVTNVVKHSRATSVAVSAAVADGTLTIEIADNGRGFQPAAPSVAEDGLRNMEKRLRDIGGEITVAATSGTGTSVTLRAPV